MFIPVLTTIGCQGAPPTKALSCMQFSHWTARRKLSMCLRGRGAPQFKGHRAPVTAYHLTAAVCECVSACACMCVMSLKLARGWLLVRVHTHTHGKTFPWCCMCSNLLRNDREVAEGLLITSPEKMPSPFTAAPGPE